MEEARYHLKLVEAQLACSYGPLDMGLDQEWVVGQLKHWTCCSCPYLFGEVDLVEGSPDLAFVGLEKTVRDLMDTVVGILVCWNSYCGS